MAEVFFIGFLIGCTMAAVGLTLLTYDTLRR